jgi:hypothetical protein
MTRVNNHVVALHGGLNLVDDCCTSGFNPQNLRHFNDMVGGGIFANDAFSDHTLLETVSFNEKLFVALISSDIISIFDIDDGSLNTRHSLLNRKNFNMKAPRHLSRFYLDDDIWKQTAKFTDAVELVIIANIQPETVFLGNDDD